MKSPLKFLLYVGPNAKSLSKRLPENQITEKCLFENLEELKPWLFLRVLKNEDLPDGIVSDIPAEEKDIQNFFEVISFPETFKSIPFILYSTSELPIQTKKEWVALKNVDDIFDGDLVPEKLLSRIKFLKEFKKMKMAYKPEEEELEPVIKEDVISNVLKRGLDILASGTILLLTSPLFLIIAIIIKLESKGPVFYKSNRAGSNYKIFKFLKFRTMYVGSDAKLKEMMHLNQYSNGESGSQVFFKIASDPRITKFGSFLRNTSLDEIPQLINVLKGDMSLVGNRPLPLYEAVSLTKDEWVERFLAPAGITGLWQITKRGQKDMTVHERINLDINYANKNSFLYDLWILIKTPRALIQKENV